MAAPVPSFSTLEKVWALCAVQARAWKEVVADPAKFLGEHAPQPDENLSKSFCMLAFVVPLCILLDVPVDLYFWRVKALDPGALVTAAVVTACEVLVFAAAAYCAGRLLGGKADFQTNLAAMLFASAFLPFLRATHLVTRSDAHYRGVVLAGGDPRGVADALQGLEGADLLRPFLFAALEIGVALWIMRKTVPMIRLVHGVGTWKAALVFCSAGLASSCFETLVATPVWAEIVKQSAPP